MRHTRTQASVARRHVRGDAGQWLPQRAPVWVAMASWGRTAAVQQRTSCARTARPPRMSTSAAHAHAVVSAARRKRCAAALSAFFSVRGYMRGCGRALLGRAGWSGAAQRIACSFCMSKARPRRMRTRVAGARTGEHDKTRTVVLAACASWARCWVEAVRYLAVRRRDFSKRRNHRDEKSEHHVAHHHICEADTSGAERSGMLPIRARSLVAACQRAQMWLRG